MLKDLDEVDVVFQAIAVSEGHIKKIYNMSLWKVKEKLDRNIVRSPLCEECVMAVTT